MIANLIILGIGIILGAFLMMAITVLALTSERKPKRMPTKDEWRRM